MYEDEEGICEVKQIVNSKRGKGVAQYRVRWTGCTEIEDTWGMFAHLDNCHEKPEEFWNKIPKKLRDERNV